MDQPIENRPTQAIDYVLYGRPPSRDNWSADRRSTVAAAVIETGSSATPRESQRSRPRRGADSKVDNFKWGSSGGAKKPAWIGGAPGGVGITVYGL